MKFLALALSVSVLFFSLPPDAPAQENEFALLAKDWADASTAKIEASDALSSSATQVSALQVQLTAAQTVQAAAQVEYDTQTANSEAFRTSLADQVNAGGKVRVVKISLNQVVVAVPGSPVLLQVVSLE